MKVLYLIDTLAVGGSERSLLELTRRMEGIEPVVCYLYAGDPLRGEFEAAGTDVLEVGLAGRYRFRQGIQAVRRIVRSTSPDLIHTTLFRSDVIGRVAGRLERVPVISSFINDSYHRLRWRALTPLGRAKLLGVLLLDRLTARWVDRFIAVSVPTAASNARALGLPIDKIRVVYRGRDPQRFAARPGAREAVRGALGIDERTPVLLDVARLLVRKGHEELIHAAAVLAPRHPDLQVLLAGEGHDRARFQDLASSLGLTRCIRFLGRREDIADLLAAADVFVFPSHFEGHPGALVEAMMAGRPIVASDIPVNREMLGDDQRGRLFAVGDVEDLVEVLDSMLDDRGMGAGLGDSARRWATERFTTERMVQGHEALYREVLGEPRA